MPGVVGSIVESLRYFAPLDSVEPAIPNTATPFAPLPQVMGMPGMVGSIVESLRYITPFAIDVMLFVIIKQLASPKKKLKVGAAAGWRGRLWGWVQAGCRTAQAARARCQHARLLFGGCPLPARARPSTHPPTPPPSRHRTTA